MKRVFYWLVGLAAFFMVYQNLWAIGRDIYDWWDDRDYDYTPTYSEVVATDSVVRPVQKVRPDLGSTVIAPRSQSDGSDQLKRRYFIIPTLLQSATGTVDPDRFDEIIVTGSRVRSLPMGLSLPKLSDRKKNEEGEVAPKIRHDVQRSCRGSSYTNLLLHDRQTKTTKPIFEAPLSVIGHQIITQNKESSHIIALVAILDTNQDDKITCQDFIHMAIFDIAADTLFWVDMEKSEPIPMKSDYSLAFEIDFPQISEAEYALGVGIDENNDGLFDPQKEITEMAILDISNKSFHKVVTTAHLAEVQKIMYSEMEK